MTRAEQILSKQYEAANATQLQGPMAGSLTVGQTFEHKTVTYKVESIVTAGIRMFIDASMPGSDQKQTFKFMSIEPIN